MRIETESEVAVLQNWIKALPLLTIFFPSHSQLYAVGWRKTSLFWPAAAPLHSALYFQDKKYFFYSFSNIFSLTFNTPPSVVDVPLDHKQLVKLLPAKARAK